MALSGAELKILITSQDRASQGIKGVGGALRGLGSAAALPLKAIGGLTSALGKIGLAAFGIQAVIGAAQGLGSALGIGLASEVNESWSKVNVLFGKSSSIIDDFAKTSANSFGMSRREALAAAGNYGNLFRTMGLGQEASAKMSVQLLKTAADLGSFNNVGTEEVLEKIRAGLVGESEPLRSLGININETAVQAKAFAMGLGHLEKKGKTWVKVLSDSDKLQARAALIMAQAKTAADDFAKTHAGMANATKRITTGFENIRLAIGDKLLPVLAPLIADFADKLPGALDKLMPLITKFGSVFGGVIKLVTGGDWSEFYKGLQDAFGPETADKISNLTEKLKTFASDVGAAIKSGDWSKVTLAIQTAISDAWTGVKALAVNVWDKLTGATTTTSSTGIVTTTRVSIETMLKNAWAAVKVTGIDIWQKLFGQGNISTNTGGNMPDIGDMAVDGMSTDTRGLAQKLQQWLGAAIAGINWTTLWGSVKEAAGSAIATALNIATSVKDWLVTTWQGIAWADVWAGATTVGQGLLDGIMSIAGEVGTWLQKTWAGIDWKAVWKFATGIGQGIIDAAIDISGSLATWLGQQIGKAAALLSQSEEVKTAADQLAVSTRDVVDTSLKDEFNAHPDGSKDGSTAIANYAENTAKAGNAEADRRINGAANRTLWTELGKTLAGAIGYSFGGGLAADLAQSLGKSAAAFGESFSSAMKGLRDSPEAAKAAESSGTSVGEYLGGTFLPKFWAGLISKLGPPSVEDVNKLDAWIQSWMPHMFTGVDDPKADDKAQKRYAEGIQQMLKGVLDIALGANYWIEYAGKQASDWTGGVFAGLFGGTPGGLNALVYTWVLDNIAKPLAAALKGAPLGLGEAAEGWVKSLKDRISEQQPALSQGMVDTAAKATTAAGPAIEANGRAAGAVWDSGMSEGIAGGQSIINVAADESVDRAATVAQSAAYTGMYDAGKLGDVGTAAGIASGQGGVNAAAVGMVDKATAAANKSAYSDGLTIGQRISAGLAEGLSRAEARLRALNQQIDQVNRKKLNDPGRGGGNYASGTSYASSGLALVGERGPEFVRFRGGEQVYTAAQSRQMALSIPRSGETSLPAASTRPPISITITGNTFMGDDRSTAKRIAEILKPELDNLVRWR